MAREIERKRFHLESIIEHISEESTSIKNGSFHPSLVINPGPEQLRVSNLVANRDLDDLAENLDENKSASDSNTESESTNEKEDSTIEDESAIPTKISPRCDICSLLHFRSYRCLTIFSAPSYLRKAFDDSIQKLRVCRRCLTSKESFVENVAISSLASYSAQIRQMKIPLGMTADRRTKAFDFVVRDLKQLKNGGGNSENNEMYPFECYKTTSPLQSPVQPMRKTLLQRFIVDDPVEKNLFLKELDLYSTDLMNNTRDESDEVENDFEMIDADLQRNQSTNPSKGIEATTPVPSPEPKVTEKAVYHVTAKNVSSSNGPEKKIGEMFDARKGMSHDLVVNTKRAWKPNKKYDDLRKVERSTMKKEAKTRSLKPGKSSQMKVKVSKGEKTDKPEKVRTCGIHCAVCENHVQKSYSCCNLQTAPEKFKYLFTPGVNRLKICRKCIPYKKAVVKTESPVVVKKKTGKVKQKRGRKPKAGKLGMVVKAILSHNVLGEQGVMKDGGSVFSRFSTEPFASVMQNSTAKESASKGTVDYDRNRITSIKMANKIANMDDITTQDCPENAHFQNHSSKREQIPVDAFTS